MYNKSFLFIYDKSITTEMVKCSYRIKKNYSFCFGNDYQVVIGRLRIKV